MPKARGDVIASVPKKYLFIPTFISAILLVLAVGIYQKSLASYATVGGQKFTKEMLTTPEQQQQGLSNRAGLPGDHVAVFTYQQSDRRCFWMKDMRFSIDMVWLDASKRIVAIERNVVPETYPTQFCHDGVTVLEFTAGTADRLRLEPGQTVKL